MIFFLYQETKWKKMIAAIFDSKQTEANVFVMLICFALFRVDTRKSKYALSKL